MKHTLSLKQIFIGLTLLSFLSFTGCTEKVNTDSSTSVQPNNNQTTQNETPKASTKKTIEFPITFSYPPNVSSKIENSYLKISDGDKELFTAYKFSYDHKPDGFGDWGVSKETKAKLEKELNCSPLVKADLEHNYLPINFEKNHLCKVLKQDDLTLVYAIGAGRPFEGLPFMTALIIVLDEKEGMVLPGMYKDLTSAKYQATIESYKKKYPQMDFPDENWKSLANAVDDLIQAELKNPSKDLEKNLKFLEDFSKGIKIKKSVEAENA